MHLHVNNLRLLAIPALLVACQSAADEPADAAETANTQAASEPAAESTAESTAEPAGESSAEPAAEQAAISLEGWRPEHIPLPPEFAPTMPAGDERLLFAPGMFDAEAEDFWSYAFVMRIEEANVDASRMNEIFELYYDGLVLSVGGKEVGENPATVSIVRSGAGEFKATIDLVEPFVTMERINLNLLIEATSEGDKSTFLRIQASPQALEHEIWRSIKAAADSLEL